MDGHLTSFQFFLILCTAPDFPSLPGVCLLGARSLAAPGSGSF